MTFDRPWALAFFVPACVLILAGAWRSRALLAPLRRRLSVAARLSLAALGVLALAAPRLTVERPPSGRAIYLVDVSDSVPLAAREAVLGRIAQCARSSGSDVEHWVVAFGGGAAARRLEDPAEAERDPRLRELLLFPAVESEARRALEGVGAGPARAAAEASLQRIARLREDLMPAETDLRAGLRALGTCPGGGRAPALYVFTDGRTTRPFGAADWAAWRGTASALTVVDLGVGVEPGVEVLALAVPPAVDAGQPFDAVLRVEAHGGEAVSARLMVDDVPRQEVPLACAPGTNVVTFPRIRIEEPGLHRLKAVVDMQGDAEPRNNIGVAFVHVGPPPSVLLVEGRRGLAAHLESALAIQGIRAERIEAARLPARREALARFGALACVGVPADQLSPEAAAAMRSAVEQDGVGLLFGGGPHLAGTKSWRGHPAERLLPVAFEPYEPPPPPAGSEKPPAPSPPPAPPAPRPAEVESSAITLVLLIDKSGSMAGDNIRLAREAAIAAVETLGDGDFVAVIAFDVQPKVVLETTSAVRVEFIRDRIARIQADGGTHVFPALQLASRLLQNDRSQARHVIVLSDGITQLADYRGLIQRMRADRITVSSVCVATDLQFDWTLMHNLAAWGGGRFYPALGFNEVPQIFTKETRVLVEQRDKDRAAREAKARAAQPALPSPTPPATPPAPVPAEIPLRLVSPEDAMKGLDPARIPPVGGLLPAVPRDPSVTVLAAAADRRPALVLGRAGLGRTAAWLSDWSDAWGRRWLDWDRFPAFAAQLVRQLLRRGPSNPFPGTVLAEVRDGTVHATIDFREAAAHRPDERIEILAAWRREKGPEHPLPMRRVGPAATEGDFPAPPPGEAAMIHVRFRQGPHVWDAAPVGVAQAFPEEFRRSGPRRAFDAAAGAGIAVRTLDDALPPPLTASTPADSRSIPLSVPFLVAALLLLPVDVALRRVR
jgi:Ca-activated chloride channel family protein